MGDRPSSLAAERAIRRLRESDFPLTSLDLAHDVLALRLGDEGTATHILTSAFAGDPRLVYEGGHWQRVAQPANADAGGSADPPEPDVAFVLVEGSRPAPRAPFRLTAVVAARRSRGEIVDACGGETAAFAAGHNVPSLVRGLLAGARAVVHAPPGGLGALEAWLEDVLDEPVSLALLARRRAGLPREHSVEDLAARLNLGVVVGDDPLRRIELLPACFDALRRAGEDWEALTSSLRATGPSLPWSRYAFTRDDLRELPPAPGTYRFYDLDDKLIYVGQSKNLKRRLASWFRDGAAVTSRPREIAERVHRYEVRPTGSGLEALLREASQIRRDAPETNTKRDVHPRGARADRLASMLILEPAEAPWVVRAWLIRDGRLVDSVPLGKRGGGLKRIARTLESDFFDPRAGPRSTRSRPVDVEIIARWLAEHRDDVVAFDPTHLRTAEEVVARLEWFLARGSLREPEGSPILPRG